MGALNLVLAFLFALASYKLVEQPFLRLKDRFSVEARSAATEAEDRVPGPAA